MASTIDYPNVTSTVLFVGKCNWNCDFCYNTNLVNEQDINFEKDILPKMLKRKKFINHVVISGGEISCYPNEAIHLIDLLNRNGFIVGIHSNGSNLEFLKEVIKHDIKFIGMDIKTSFKRYDDIINCCTDIEIIKKSIDFIINIGIEYEFRTTVYPKYVNNEDCINIAKYLKKHSSSTNYMVQQFDDSHIDTEVIPYSKLYLEEVVKECNKYIKTNLRGY